MDSLALDGGSGGCTLGLLSIPLNGFVEDYAVSLPAGTYTFLSIPLNGFVLSLHGLG